MKEVVNISNECERICMYGYVVFIASGLSNFVFCEVKKSWAGYILLFLALFLSLFYSLVNLPRRMSPCFGLPWDPSCRSKTFCSLTEWLHGCSSPSSIVMTAWFVPKLWCFTSSKQHSISHLRLAQKQTCAASCYRWMI